MFTVDGALHLIVESTVDDTKTVEFRYEYTESGWIWSPVKNVSKSKAARGGP